MVQTHDPEPVWDKPPDVDEKWIDFVDDNVSSKLPQGTQIQRISRYGASYWTRTAEIATIQADGLPFSFFLKVAQHATGKAMVSGEFESMSALHRVMPRLVPIPFAWGTYAVDSNIHFFLCEFIDMIDELPDVQALSAGLAELHHKGVNPEGKYGFHVPTLQATVPQYTDWEDSWETFFSKSIHMVMINEERSQGADLEMQKLCNAILEKVVPRLLRPLETGGRSIQPRLVHGDIWDGNVSTNLRTNTPMIFDATSIYAHNESVVELAPIRPIRHRMGNSYVQTYFKHFPASEPEVDQDDRNALYCLRWDLNCSTLYPGNLRFRNICLDVMRTLTAKYAGGYDDWAREMGEEPVVRSVSRM